MPSVVNLKKMVADDWLADTIYIGRPGKLADKMFAAHPEMRDGTALGNPFKPQGYGVIEDCLKDYRRWLDVRIRPRNADMLHVGRPARDTLDSIKESTALACWCKPEPCHGDIIVRAWNWYQKEKQTNFSKGEQK